MPSFPPPFTGFRRWLASSWLELAVLLLALFLVVTGARLWLVQNYTTQLPYMDQWDGEGVMVLKPWIEGHLRFWGLFVPHNEHCIFLTRVLELGLFSANGQWDGQLEAAVDAALCGGFAVLMAGALVGVFGGAWRWTITLAVAVYGVLPFGWENTLNGFGSQNYFLIIFSLAAIWGLGLHRVKTSRWWVGLAGACLACLSMGSGFLAAAAVLGLLGWRVGGERARLGWNEGITATVCAGIVAVGWLTRTVVPGHAILKTESPTTFLRAFCRFLAWPLYEQPWCLPLMAAPLVILLVVRPGRVLATRERTGDPRVYLLLGVGVWCALQVAALAYSRDGHGAPPACRYMDLLAIFPLTNFLALALLVMAVSKKGVRYRIGTVLAAGGWLAALAAGLWPETAKDLSGWLPWYFAAQRASEGNTLGYLRTGDFARYLAGKTQQEIPYPNPQRLAGLLDDSTIRGILPADVRTPLPVAMAGAEGGAAFTRDGLPPGLLPPGGLAAWGSYPGREGVAHGSLRETGKLVASLPYLQFQFAGYLGEPGLRFVLQDIQTGRRVDWRPAHAARERWRGDDLPRPGSHLNLIASGAGAGKWFAFTEPVEMGAWSHWTGWTLRRSLVVFWAGWGVAIAAWGLGVAGTLARRIRGGAADVVD